MENIYLEIGKRIRQQRKAHGLTREEFAENLKLNVRLHYMKRAFSETIRRYLRSVRLTTVLAMSLSVIMPLNPGQRTN